MNFKSSIGFEVELFLIDSKGKIQSKADEVLNLTSSLKHHPVKEYTKEVIEINALPSELVEGAIIDYITTFYEIDDLIQKENLYLLPLSTYPGDYVPVRREDTYYTVKEKIFGKNNMENASRCTGFHLHYPIPQKERKLIQLYNFFISTVPFFDAFMQSSPFYKSKFVAKDTRAFAYRDMSINEVEGAYSRDTLFGGIPDYEVNFYSLLNRVQKRNREWASRVLKQGYSLEEVGYSREVDYYWGAVRLNPRVSTIELRSPDVNLPSNLLEAVYFFRTACDKIMESFEVVISEGDVFYVEDEKLHIPSMENVKRASYEASLYGFESDFAYNYAKSLFNIFSSANKLSKFNEMLNERKSFSDYLLLKAKKQGWEENTPLERENYTSLSLHVAELMIEEMDIVRKRALSLFSELNPVSSLFEGDLTSKILEYIGEEKHNNIDLSRSSPGRLGNIKAIIISPEVWRRVKNRSQVMRDLNILKERFVVLLPVFEKDASKFKGFDNSLKLLKIKDEVSEDEYVKTLKGLIKLWAEASKIDLKHILYFGVEDYEKELMKYFGASATFSKDSKTKDVADVVVETILEISKFVGKK